MLDFKVKEIDVSQPLRDLSPRQVDSGTIQLGHQDVGIGFENKSYIAKRVPKFLDSFENSPAFTFGGIVK